MGFTVEIINGAVRTEASAEKGDLILTVLQRESIMIPALCGGRGTCKKCRVVVNHDGKRQVLLACLTAVEPGMSVELAAEEPMVICDTSTTSLAALYPPDAGADAAAGGVAAADAAADAAVHVVADAAALAAVQRIAVAVDVGTTTVVVRLLDRFTGEAFGNAMDMNPQALFGADVLSRVDAVARGELGNMTELIQSCITRLIREVADRVNTGAFEGAAGASGDAAGATGGPASGMIDVEKDIWRIAIAGNTIMEHIVAGLSPVSIGVAPFTPLSLFGEVLALEGLGAPVWLAPAVAGYIGGDITCGLLAAQVLQKEETLLFLDLGTNGELALYDGGRIHCCATAAGPVFEGGGVHFGMSALPGAINHLTLTAEQGIELTTIAGIPARGICGTGLVCAVAAFLKAGLIDDTGLVAGVDEVGPAYAGLLGREAVDGQEQPVIYLTDDRRLFVTQSDVRCLQLAKAAVLAGILTMLEEAGIGMEAVRRVVIAGGFGAALDIESAACVGLIPAALKGRAEAVGNTALEGAEATVLSSRAREDLSSILELCDYIELSTSAVFNQHFIQCIYFEGA